MKTLCQTSLTQTRLMRIIRRSMLALLLVIATAAYGGVPSMNVIVSDSSGRVAFKGATNASASFATGNLASGNYVVQFHSKNALKGNQYLLVVAAGSKKVIADAVPGEKFNGGGVAMRVAMEPGLRITGQVATDQASGFVLGQKIRVIDGKRYVWVRAQTGSNLGDHWEPEGVAAARFVATISNEKLRRIQDASFEGSLLDRHPGMGHDVTAGHSY